MIRRAWRLAWPILFLTLGCAGLEAHRVPLPKRMSGEDAHIHGFRYYLSRPYLVVP